MALGVFSRVRIEGFVMLPQGGPKVFGIEQDMQDAQLLAFQTAEDECKSAVHLLA